MKKLKQIYEKVKEWKIYKKIKSNQIKYLVIIIWIIMYVNGNLTIERVQRFIIILGIILIYRRVLIKLEKGSFLIDKIYKRSKKLNPKRLEKLKKVIKLLLKVLIIINKYRNPLVPIMYKLEKEMFYLIRSLNSHYIKKKKCTLSNIYNNKKYNESRNNSNE